MLYLLNRWTDRSTSIKSKFRGNGGGGAEWMVAIVQLPEEMYRPSTLKI